MSRVRKRLQLPSDLSKEGLQDPLTDPSDRIQPLDCCLLRAQTLLDLVVEPPDGSLQGVDHAQQLL